MADKQTRQTDSWGRAQELAQLEGRRFVIHTHCTLVSFFCFPPLLSFVLFYFDLGTWNRQSRLALLFFFPLFSFFVLCFPLSYASFTLFSF
jgi:hypothetical protein